MPSLIPEILFQIGKSLIEEKNLDAAIQFGLFGKECLRALENVFASVTTLELYDEHFVIGWNKKHLMFQIPNFPKSLVYCIGGSVKELHIEREINSFFQPIIDTITSKRQLISFSAGNNSYCSQTLFIKNFLPLFSTTLKNIEIPFRSVPDILADNLFCLKSLTLTNAFNYSFESYTNLLMTRHQKYREFFSSIKHLTFYDKTGRLYTLLCLFDLFVGCFPLLENLYFDVKYHGFIRRDIEFLKKSIKQSKTFPSKVVYTVLSNGIMLKSEADFNLRICKKICNGFDYDGSIPKFHKFHQKIQSMGSHEIIFEVLIPKMQKMIAENWIDY